MVIPEHSMPENKLPSCWSDDIRMNALFAPFRIKSANPESWQMKVKFWSDMLRQWCRCKNDPLVSASDAKVAFMRKGRTPVCIDIVVEECLRSGELVPLSKYQTALHNGPEGWIRWGAHLAFKSVALAATTVTSLLPARQSLDSDGLPKSNIDPTQYFVLEAAVKEQALELLRMYPVEAEKMGTVEDLMQNCEYPSSRRESFEVLLGYMVTQGLAVKKGDVVKLAETLVKVSPITESDEALYRLYAAEKKLVADAERYHKDAQRALEEARVAMKLGNKLAAKNNLRRKHKCLERAQGCDSALENVRQIQHNMKQMEVNTAVASTYKFSSDAMKKSMQDGGLSEDAAHETMDELKEVLESYNEVEKALSYSADDLDMQELEQELSELLAGTGPSGGTPGAEKDKKPAPRIQSPGVKPRKVLEKDFVFDGEERMMAELNDLSIEDRSLENVRSVLEKKKKERAAVAEGAWRDGEYEDRRKPSSNSSQPSRSWHPPQEEFLEDHNKNPWTKEAEENIDTGFQDLCNSFNEIRLDERLHPGQKLNLSFKGPPSMYKTDFQVQDHMIQDNVWFYNSNDRVQKTGGLQNSTEYFSAESPGKSADRKFEMAPGCERKTHLPSTSANGTEDLEVRLKNLRGYNE